METFLFLFIAFFPFPFFVDILFCFLPLTSFLLLLMLTFHPLSFSILPYRSQLPDAPAYGLGLQIRINLPQFKNRLMHEDKLVGHDIKFPQSGANIFAHVRAYSSSDLHGLTQSRRAIISSFVRGLKLVISNPRASSAGRA